VTVDISLQILSGPPGPYVACIWWTLILIADFILDGFQYEIAAGMDLFLLNGARQVRLLYIACVKVAYL
jgi:hypothetical protein